MGLRRVFGVLLRVCVLVVCVGLVGCRLSETSGPVDELRLLDGRKTEDRGPRTEGFEEDAAVEAREALADFPLESVLYVDVSGGRDQPTGGREQGKGNKRAEAETERLQGYLNQAFASFSGFQGSGDREDRPGLSFSSVLNPVSSQVTSGMDQAWGQAMGGVPDGMAADLPYQDQRFVAAFYGAMQGLAGQ
ncbi:MAG: hypothetical protein ACKO57_08655, partial [Alphaproteobacteria bacterium]